jgi:FKBP-type peptidyl-prolyl cis-trans isomerase SlpA
MHFTLSLEDGTVADTTREDNEPIEFAMGDGTLIEGLELALYGLKAGDKQTLKIAPDIAFGYHDSENVHTMDRAEFASDMDLKRGTIVEFTTPTGEAIAGTVLEADDNQVEVDFNHPLAGHEITFEVEILSVD